MTPDDEALISSEIDRAYEFAARGAHRMAAQSFAATRSMCVELADRTALERKIQYVHRKALRERDQYREIIASRRSSGRPLVIFSDSLGLPRPDEVAGPFAGAERTYPFMLVDRLPQHSVNSHCQRYFTTRHVLDLLHGDSTLGVDSDVVLHVGLNDCAWRMFLENERLALDLLAPALKDKIVGFSQKHRLSILRELPLRHYVEPGHFQANVDAILELLSHRGARVVVTTIIIPPLSTWSNTPGMERNFTHYNLMLMNAAARHAATLLDLDRLIWFRKQDGDLLPDGMHLGASGHALMTEQLAIRLP